VSLRVLVRSLVAGGVLLAACSGTPQPAQVEHIAGEGTDLFLPPAVTEAPLVVLVPGGAWRTADPAGLLDLAEQLAHSGIASMTATIRAADDGVSYPIPVEDVLCAAASAAAQMSDAGITPREVVLFGHSTGAHLAALAALGPERYQPDCSDPLIVATGLIAVAGTYDVDALPTVAVDLFGVPKADAPEMWEEGNALRAAGLHPEVPVLVIHGDADTLVPMFFTEEFAAALTAGGHAVALHVIPGADHHAVYRPETVADLITDWVQSL
jgi:acetyl esterase/lipase